MLLPKRHQIKHLEFVVSWFGTRGSEVQILSPRPIFSLARLTFVVLPAQKADTYTLPDLPLRNVPTDLLDSAHDLMARHSW